MKSPKVILIVMDGWGYTKIKEGNAVLNAKKPTFDEIWAHYPHTLLSASGEEVGLPWGELGGSEVGHLTIGSGRILYQNFPRITSAINDGSFFKNDFLNNAISNAQAKKSNLHLIGLVSSGGVHSHINHVEAILKIIKKRRFSGHTYIHMITDGRDTSPKSAQMFLFKVKEIIDDLKINVQFATLSGRYFAMDRDHHWDRTLMAYEAMVDSKGQTATSPEEAIDQAYKRKETDEFINPTVIYNQITPNASLINNLFKKQNSQTAPSTVSIQDNDSLIFFNFRPDRMRQIVELFLFPRLDMPKKTTHKNLYVVSMTNYNESMPVNVAFPLEHIRNTVGQIVSQHQMSQLHIAETEKYAHVTYFFNGGYPEAHENEKWQLIPSPKVATFDQKPEMSAPEITDYILKNVPKIPYDFILINFANADMVGHTGSYKATIKAVETIDIQLGRLIKAFPETYFVISSDHGNAEEMINPQTGEINTGHSVNPVPVIIVHPSLRLKKNYPISNQASGMIADLGPTVLYLLGLKPSQEMTGFNLLESIGPNISNPKDDPIQKVVLH